MRLKAESVEVERQMHALVESAVQTFDEQLAMDAADQHDIDGNNQA